MAFHEIIECSNLNSLSGIQHAFFTRKGGTSKGLYESLNIGLGSDDNRQDVLKNRAICAAHFNLPLENLATPYQIHSDKVAIIHEIWNEEERPKADGLVTNKPNIVLGIATADCGPVLFADYKAGVIGAAHAGWRGATSGVLDNMLDAMETLGAKRENIHVSLGPTIAQKSYEVGPDFIKTLLDLEKTNDIYLIPSSRQGHALFDLPAYINGRLKELGTGKISILKHDTYEHEDLFYSFRRTTHRAEKDYGRLLSAIVLK